MRVDVDQYYRFPVARRFADDILAANGVSALWCLLIEQRDGMHYAEMLSLNDQGKPYVDDDGELVTHWVSLPTQPPGSGA